MAEPINLELLARHLQGIRAELRDMQFHAENDRRNVRSQFDNLAATHASQLGDVEAKMAARLDRIETLFGDRGSQLRNCRHDFPAHCFSKIQARARLAAAVYSCVRERLNTALFGTGNPDFYRDNGMRGNRETFLQ